MKSILTILGAFALSLIIISIFTYPVMLLWNSCLVPAVNSLNPITFWQSLGILLLTNILFKQSSTSKND